MPFLLLLIYDGWPWLFWRIRINRMDDTFHKIQQLVNRDPFQPFTIRSGGKDIEVSHRNAIAFHPEVPFVGIYTRDNVYHVPIAKVDHIAESYSTA